MKLEKAIEILTFMTKPYCPKERIVTYDAIKLGIEALKRIKHKRNFSPHLELKLLPGETKE